MVSNLRSYGIKINHNIRLLPFNFFYSVILNWFEINGFYHMPLLRIKTRK